MPTRFTLENWEQLDNSGRIVLCQTMTRTALKLSKNAPFNVSEAFLRLAECWSRLATEISLTSLEPPNRVPGPLPPV